MAERVPFRGGLTCSCVVASLPWVEKELQFRGVITGPLRIFQLGYRTDVGASAGTHARGGCVDIEMLGPAGIDFTRLWGWTFQPRRLSGVVEHCHGWPYKCTHLSSAAQQQESDWDRKDAGLVGGAQVQGRWPVEPWAVALRERKALLEEETMPTSKEIWNWDGIESPDGSTKWQPDSYLRNIYNRVDTVETRLAAQDKKLDAILAAIKSAESTP